MQIKQLTVILRCCFIFSLATTIRKCNGRVEKSVKIFCFCRISYVSFIKNILEI